MDVRFLPHNAHLEHAEAFAEWDPHLRVLSRQPYIYRSPVLDRFPRTQAGVYTLHGGRQIGKTTLLKQWMAELLLKAVSPQSIAFLTGELIDDHHSLVRLITELLSNNRQRMFLIIDEVTYIRGWDRGIKYLADSGALENIVLMLSGSDLIVMRDARMRLPGRRGQAQEVDFHLYPLTLRETTDLKKTFTLTEHKALNDSTVNVPTHIIKKLFVAFDDYLIHGGYLTAINDIAKVRHIEPSTMATYSDWIRGDVLRRGKQEGFLREILNAVDKRYGSQITWNSLAKDLSIDHPKTIADYLELLEAMDVVFVQQALIEDKRVGAPKKARKVYFWDPFIYHAARSWLEPAKDFYDTRLIPRVRDALHASCIVEGVVAAHYRRLVPTYYIKAEGEVDIAYVYKERFWPVEVKWSHQIRPKDIAQLRKYKNALLLNRSQHPESLDQLVCHPLPLELYRLPNRFQSN